LTNLYVGLGRFHRGEKLSALRFIQHHAVDRFLELTEQVEAAQHGSRTCLHANDGMNNAFPPPDVNPAITKAIRQLC
jgi:hypothetical protein